MEEYENLPLVRKQRRRSIENGRSKDVLQGELSGMRAGLTRWIQRFERVSETALALALS